MHFTSVIAPIRWRHCTAENTTPFQFRSLSKLKIATTVVENQTQQSYRRSNFVGDHILRPEAHVISGGTCTFSYRTKHGWSYVNSRYLTSPSISCCTVGVWVLHDRWQLEQWRTGDPRRRGRHSQTSGKITGFCSCLGPTILHNIGWDFYYACRTHSCSQQQSFAYAGRDACGDACASSFDAPRFDFKAFRRVSLLG